MGSYVGKPYQFVFSVFVKMDKKHQEFESNKLEWY